MVMSKQDKTDYKRKFNEENYKRSGVYLKEDLYEELEAHRAATGESRNAFIIRAIRETIERDKKGTIHLDNETVSKIAAKLTNEEVKRHFFGREKGEQYEQKKIY